MDAKTTPAPCIFRLDAATRVKIKNTSPRKEHDGDELKQAIDVDVEWETHNQHLSMFGHDLLDSIYYRDEANTKQETVAGVPLVKPNLRNPLLTMPVKWTLEDEGRDVKITPASGTKKQIHLADCKAKKFSFNFKEGGSVVICFQVQCNTDLDTDKVGRLCALEGEPVDMTLTGATTKD